MADTTGERRGVVRDRLVDGGLVAFAALAGLWPAVYWFEIAPTPPVWLPYLDYVAGVLGCLALWWRRRFPLVLAAVLVLVSALALSAGAAALIALLTVAVHRSARATAVVAVGNVLSIRPHVVLMDIRMPGTDGITATEALRARTPAPQVVVLTTSGTPWRSRSAPGGPTPRSPRATTSAWPPSKPTSPRS